jgi:magnesium transporter
MVAGIYGMNFDNMPELRWHYGYYAILLVMGVVCFTMYRFFRKVGWL